MFILSNIAVILFITTALNLAGTLIAWRRRFTRTGHYFALGMASITFWTLMAGMGYAAVPLDLTILFAKLDAVGYLSALSMFLFSVMYFAGLDKWADKKWLRVIVFFLPGSSILLIATNEWHGWVWRGFRSVQNNVVVFEHGPGYLWVAFTGYLLMIALIVILWQVARKGSLIQRRQARLLLFACLFPLTANIVYQYGIHGAEGVDWSSLTFSVTALLFLLALYFMRFSDLIPIARDKLIASLGDGMIVVDARNRIIDMNPAVEKYFGLRSSSLLGTNLKDIAPPESFALLESSAGQEVRTEFEFGDPDRRYYDVLISPIQDQNQNAAPGRLILFRDITTRHRLETEREQLIDDLERRNAESESLRETTMILTSTLDISEAVQRILQQLKRVIAYDSASVWLYKDMTAQLVGGDGLPEIAEKDKQYPLSDADPDYPLWGQNQPYVLRDDVQVDYPVFREPPINYIRSWMGIPLKTQGVLKGFIAIDGRKVAQFTQADAELAMNYANQVSVALENARLFSGLQVELKQHQRLINDLDALNANLAREVSERTLVEKELQQRFLEIRQLNQELEESQAQIVEHQRALAATQERQRLGRDLHDSVNQSIHSLMLFSETLVDLLQNGQTEQAIQAAERIHKSGEQALREVRLLVHGSQAVFIHDCRELVETVAKRLDMVERRVGIETGFDCTDSALEHCPADWAENLYWIILEALNNSLKHARASQVQVMIGYENETLTVEVKDDGAGINPGQERGGGFGMQSMRERAEELGGRLTVQSSPGIGTQVKFIGKVER